MKTILLLHGWNNVIYTRYKCTDPWYLRQKLIAELSKTYKIEYIVFPGFCGVEEPNSPWNLTDFAHYVQNEIEKRNITPDAILGYSFGGAVAVRWQRIYKTKTKLVLVSPAIIRAHRKIYTFKFVSFLPNTLRNIFRNLYLFLIRNKFYTEGTPFLKASYLNVVKENLSEELSATDPESYTVIFGSEDTATPPKLLLKNAPAQVINRISVIEGGGHDIANTHTQQLALQIRTFIESIK